MSHPPSLPPGASSPDESRPFRGRPRDPDGVREVSSDRPAGGSSSSTMALVLHALTFLCCANWLFGVIGIVFAVRAAHKRDRGLHEEAETLTRYSWYCLGAGAVMLLVTVILSGIILTQAGSWVNDIAPVTNY
ncbi:hypothetical protein ACQEU5_10630 [Marinactinospora thermotolerans]|uniref:Interferon-induced transmembrane protein n=1 Tax=Marinactinospora thermotolerans DSM 45154 TaxID=1122192 RepID=A0A1T4MXC0_9ACTN|nr:hypothetical protein [Marinactinospora thermotolerans]SJZ71494.1 hypothetical protein SAMN02745673_01173 [Marinactinospora thermotolerans DSM 45154]